MATHSRTAGWRIPWTEEPGGLQSLGFQSKMQLSMCRGIAQTLPSSSFELSSSCISTSFFFFKYKCRHRGQTPDAAGEGESGINGDSSTEKDTLPCVKQIASGKF